MAASLDHITRVDVRATLACIRHHAFGADDGEDENERRSHLFSILFEVDNLVGLLELDTPAKRDTIAVIPLAGGDSDG